MKRLQSIDTQKNVQKKSSVTECPFCSKWNAILTFAKCPVCVESQSEFVTKQESRVLQHRHTDLHCSKKTQVVQHFFKLGVTWSTRTRHLKVVQD